MIYFAYSHRIFGSPEERRAREAALRYANTKRSDIWYAGDLKLVPDDYAAYDRVIDKAQEVIVLEHAGHMSKQNHDIVLRAFLAQRTVWGLDPNFRSLSLAVDLLIIDSGDTKVRYARLALSDRVVSF